MVEGVIQSQVAEAESAYASSESAHASSREALVALEIAQAESECEHDAALQALKEATQIAHEQHTDSLTSQQAHFFDTQARDQAEFQANIEHLEAAHQETLEDHQQTFDKHRLCVKEVSARWRPIL